METGIRGYLLTGRTSFLEPYTKAVATLPNEIASIRNLTEDDSVTQQKIDEWQQQIDHFQATLASQLQAYNEHEIKTISTDSLEQQKQQLDSLRESIEQHIAQRLEKLQQQINLAKDEEVNFLHILVIGSILAICAMLLATLIILALISRTQRAGQHAAQAEERFRAVMNGINDGLFDFDLAKSAIYYSPAYKALLGYTDEEYPNVLESFTRSIHPDDYELTVQRAHQYQDREIPHYTNVFRMRHKDGSWRWVLSRGIGFWNGEGKMVRLIGTHMDITDQKKREVDLQQANSDLETFTYIASHDLRSPLVNLKGFANELKHALERMKNVIDPLRTTLSAEEQKILRESLDQDIPEALRFIEKSTERMDTLTTAVLDLSRIGKREYNNHAVHVQAIVDKCLGAQAYEITEKNVEVVCNPLPDVISDALALEQIFSNLLDNAVKYLTRDRKGKIVISARENQTDIIFSIEDNGRGIVEADLQKIFEMFRRARNADDVRGSGMGMAFVRATLRQIGGAIWCESTLNVGTTFFVRLPKRLKG